MLGKLLDGRYKIIQVLGMGGFGQTFIAEDTRRPGNPRCVVKQLKPASQDPNFLQVARRLFTTEAEILEKLGHHDQIPLLLAYFEEDQEFYLVQEFIAGHPLSDELTPGVRLSEFPVIMVVQDILGTLDFVHRNQVIHRDIKPNNLIRREQDGRLVLIDFGAVKEIRTQLANTGQTGLTVGIGTQGYMPGEQVMGKPKFSSDIYAVGMIAIKALTGLEPAQIPEDPNTGEILWRQKAQVREELATVLDKMVRSHFTQRYQSAQEVLQDLQKLQAPPTLPVTPTYNTAPQAITQPFHVPPTVVNPAEPVGPNQTEPVDAKPTAAIAPRRWPIWVGLGSTATVAIAALAVFQSPLFRSTPNPNSSYTQNTKQTSPGDYSDPNTSKFSLPPRPENLPGAPPLIPAIENRPLEQAPGNMPQVRRVSFPRGATGTTMQGNLGPEQRQRYVLNCGAGQLMTVRAVDGNINFTVISPDGQVLGTSSGDWQEELPTNGDYIIEVSAPGGSDYRISFDVVSAPASAMPAAPTVQTSRVSFAAGATGTTLDGYVTSNQVQRYLINCGKDQQMTLQILEGRVNVTVITPNGQLLGTAVDGNSFWQGTLPTRGDYVIEVSAPSAVNYAVSLEVL